MSGFLAGIVVVNIVGMGLFLSYALLRSRQPRLVAAIVEGDGSAPILEEVLEDSSNVEPDSDAKNVMAEAMAIYGSRGEAAYEEVDTAPIDESPIVRLANVVIQLAIKHGASHIHVEPDARGVRVRYRIDGILYEWMQMPRYIQAPLAGRYKVMAEMSMAGSGLPQEGQIGITYDGRPYNLRVATLPTRYGERFTMRIYDHQSARRPLHQLGLLPDPMQSLLEIAEKPRGLILFVGPNGSGKTTTAYSLMNHINLVSRNMLTVEAAPEYVLSGITQTYADPKNGRTFGTLIESFLLQDPDVILLDEIRDAETMRLALEAARSHLVLTTMFATDAPAALDKLVDMGFPPSLLSETIQGIVTQRIGRKACFHCKVLEEVSATELHDFGLRPEPPYEQVSIARIAGCERCRQTGYLGRIGFYSFLPMDDYIGTQLLHRSAMFSLREAIRQKEPYPIRQDALIKILEGITTMDEVRRIGLT